MTINISIKANVDNLTLTEIYQLIEKFSLEKESNDQICEFKGYKFRVEASIGMSINYIITELSQ